MCIYILMKFYDSILFRNSDGGASEEEEYSECV